MIEHSLPESCIQAAGVFLSSQICQFFFVCSLLHRSRVQRRASRRTSLRGLSDVTRCPKAKGADVTTGATTGLIDQEAGRVEASRRKTAVPSHKKVREQAPVHNLWRRFTLFRLPFHIGQVERTETEDFTHRVATVIGSGVGYPASVCGFRLGRQSDDWVRNFVLTSRLLLS